ncbi:MAG: glutaredoxin family protein [Acidobacteriota bacterium]|nr:glutaredoxin family protein [Acidobacteriota bacterium]
MRLTLYTRPGCHLCEEIKALLSRLKTRQAFMLTEIDISSSPTLQLLYQDHIPVLLLDGEEVARHRVSEAELLRLLQKH